MKHNKKWQVFFLSAILAIGFTGCGHKQNLPSGSAQTSSKTQETGSLTDNIYNAAFEKYSDVTELGVVINNPTEEDLSKLTTLDTYGDDKQNAMLIIPKYNGSKITVNSAEYTGEQYIAKDVLFTKESTPEGYGLKLNAYRPEGIPKLIVVINYQNVNYKYVVTSNGKDGNTGIEYLKLEPEANKEQQGDMISSVQDPAYTKGLNLFNKTDIDIDKDGQNETVEIYCDAVKDNNGEYMMDDGQTWTVILRKDNKIYPLFDKAFVQLGKIQYVVYQDYNDYDKVHVIIEHKTGAAIYYYDCTYDDESGNILRNSLFEASNINLIDEWE